MTEIFNEANLKKIKEIYRLEPVTEENIEEWMDLYLDYEKVDLDKFIILTYKLTLKENDALAYRYIVGANDLSNKYLLKKHEWYLKKFSIIDYIEFNGTHLEEETKKRLIAFLAEKAERKSKKIVGLTRLFKNDTLI